MIIRLRLLLRTWGEIITGDLATTHGSPIDRIASNKDPVNLLKDKILSLRMGEINEKGEDRVQRSEMTQVLYSILLMVTGRINTIKK